MLIFELTDKEIKVYNQKNKQLIIEPIPEDIILKNKIYDYLKLVKIINNIVDKYKLNNKIFRVNIKVIIFEQLSPTEIFLIKNLFRNISNFKVDIINVYRLFDDTTIFISGNILYYKNKILKTLKKGIYILIGNTDKYEEVKNNLEKKYKIRLLEYENSNTIIYENI